VSGNAASSRQRDRRQTVDVPGTGPAVARSVDQQGRLVDIVRGDGSMTVFVPAGGFVIAVR
jgi:hypothetical protein